jgi:hypothetical protein
MAMHLARQGIHVVATGRADGIATWTIPRRRGP